MDFPIPPKKAKWKYGNVPVKYELLDIDIGTGITLPPYFSCRPVVGDLVESEEGRRFEIREVIHIIDGEIAAVKVVISKPTGGTSPSGGGGANDIMGAVE